MWQTIPEYSHIVHESEDGSKQVRLTVNEFRGVEYLHLREYYQSFEEEWLPTKKGVCFPLNLTNSYSLFTGLVEILSLAESRNKITEHFKEIFEDINNGLIPNS